MYDENTKYDKLSLERTIKGLSSLGIRQSPLTWEKAKIWTRQFEDGPEKALALLILRHLVFRTISQIESSLRQAVKAAAHHFREQYNLPEESNWREILNGKIGGLSFYCSPPAGQFSSPGKSGELIARTINRLFDVEKSYSYNFTVFKDDEHLLIVDDGTYTGEQLDTFLTNYTPAITASSKIAIIVAIAHEDAIARLRRNHPQIPVFYGELLSKNHCFERLAESWISNSQWPFTEISPIDVYNSICTKHNLLKSGKCVLGFGNLGVIVGYEHGIPDDSLNILWEKSESWLPLIDR